MAKIQSTVEKIISWNISLAKSMKIQINVGSYDEVTVEVFPHKRAVQSLVFLLW